MSMWFAENLGVLNEKRCKQNFLNVETVNMNISLL